MGALSGLALLLRPLVDFFELVGPSRECHDASGLAKVKLSDGDVCSRLFSNDCTPRPEFLFECASDVDIAWGDGLLERWFDGETDDF